MDIKKQREEMLLSACQVLIFCSDSVNFGDLLEFSRIVMDPHYPVTTLFMEGRKMQIAFLEYMSTDKGKAFAALFGNVIARLDTFGDITALYHQMVSHSREITEASDPLWNAWVEMRESIAGATMSRINVNVIKEYVMKLARERPLIAHGNIVEIIGRNMADIEDVSSWDNILAIVQNARKLLVEKQEILKKINSK